MASFFGCSRTGKAYILRNGPNRVSGPFPKNAENRSFQNSWYERFQWVEFNVDTGGARTLTVRNRILLALHYID